MKDLSLWRIKTTWHPFFLCVARLGSSDVMVVLFDSPGPLMCEVLTPWAFVADGVRTLFSPSTT